MARLALLLTAFLAHSVVATSIYPGNSDWGYAGCYNETTTLNATDNQRALPGSTETLGQNMTVPICQQFCATGKYNFAGLEYTNECYCGFSINALSTRVPDSDCNLPCTGNTTQFCGGALKLSVYNTTYSAKKGAAGKTEMKLGSALALGVAVGGLLCLA